MIIKIKTFGKVIVILFIMSLLLCTTITGNTKIPYSATQAEGVIKNYFINNSNIVISDIVNAAPGIQEYTEKEKHTSKDTHQLVDSEDIRCVIMNNASCSYIENIHNQVNVSDVTVEGDLDLSNLCMPGKSLVLSNIIFKDKVIISNARLYSLKISGSYFTDGIDISHSEITNSLIVSGSHFLSKDCSRPVINAKYLKTGLIQFNRMLDSKREILTETLKRAFQFSGIKVNNLSDMALFINQYLKPATNLYKMYLPFSKNYLLFNYIMGEADFRYVNISKNIDMNNVMVFAHRNISDNYSKESSVCFSFSSILGSFFWAESVSETMINLTDTKIYHNLQIHNTLFCNPSSSKTNIRINNSIIDNKVFIKPIGQGILSSYGVIEMNNTSVGELDLFNSLLSLSQEKVILNRVTNYSDSHKHYAFEGSSLKSKGIVSFKSTKILSGKILLTESIIEQDLDFSSAMLSKKELKSSTSKRPNSLTLDKIDMVQENSGIEAERSWIKGSVYFKKDSFADIQRKFILNGNITLNDSIIERNLVFKDTIIASNHINLNSMSVKNKLIMEDCEIKIIPNTNKKNDGIDFRFSNIYSIKDPAILNLLDSNKITKTDLHIENLSYKHIYLEGNNSKSRNKWLDCSETFQPYEEFCDLLKKQGRRIDALNCFGNALEHNDTIIKKQEAMHKDDSISNIDKISSFIQRFIPVNFIRKHRFQYPLGFPLFLILAQAFVFSLCYTFAATIFGYKLCFSKFNVLLEVFQVLLHDMVGIRCKLNEYHIGLLNGNLINKKEKCLTKGVYVLSKINFYFGKIYLIILGTSSVELLNWW